MTNSMQAVATVPQLAEHIMHTEFSQSECHMLARMGIEIVTGKTIADVYADLTPGDQQAFARTERRFAEVLAQIGLGKVVQA